MPDWHDSKNRTTDFLFDSAHCASSIKMGEKLRGVGLHIPLGGGSGDSWSPSINGALILSQPCWLKKR